MTRRHAKDIISTISADFGHRSPHETLIADLLAVDEAIKQRAGHFGAVDAPAARIADASHVPARVQPTAPSRSASSAWWRRGIILSAVDAAGMAGGRQPGDDRPPELTPRTAELDGAHRARELRRRRARRVSGDAAVGKAFVELPFDHLFFTGSTAVGRLRRRRPRRTRRR